MKRDQLLRVLKAECRDLGLRYEVRKSEGKGSHYRVHVGDRSTIVKSGELSPLYVQIIRRQLGLD